MYVNPGAKGYSFQHILATELCSVVQ
jgi:hypothetical protein